MVYEQTALNKTVKVRRPLGGFTAETLSAVGIDGTGTYTVTDHYVTLKLNGGIYIVPTPPGNFEKKEVETYTLIFVNGNELFHGYYYKKKL